MWEIEVTDEFLDWWRRRLDHAQREALAERIDLLAERGPDSAVPSSSGSTRRDITT